MVARVANRGRRHPGPVRGCRSPVASATTSGPDGTYTLGLQAGDYVSARCCRPVGSSPSRIRVAATARTSTGPVLRATSSTTSTDDPGSRRRRLRQLRGRDDLGSEVRRSGDPEGAQDAGDPGLEGWTIEAYLNVIGFAFGSPVATAQTDEDGNYTLTVPAGDWVICEQAMTGWVQSAPSTTDNRCDIWSRARSRGLRRFCCRGRRGHRQGLRQLPHGHGHRLQGVLGRHDRAGRGRQARVHERLRRHG